MTTTIRAITVLAALIVVFLTLGPVGIRSLSPIPSELDRAVAYATLGGLATLSAPRRPWRGALLVVAMIVGLEIAQRFTVDRHGQVADVVEKLSGAALGIALAFAIRRLATRRNANTPEQ